MKKTILFAALLAGIVFFTFAQAQETWMSLGFEFGNYFENVTDSRNTYVGSPGINLNFYFFGQQKKLGVFNRNSFLFPVVKSGESNEFTYGMQMAFVIGPAFRYAFNDYLTLQSGFGVNVAGIYVDCPEGSYTYPVSSMVLGVGGDLGLKFDLTDVVFINIGGAFAFNFFNTFSVKSMPPAVEKWLDGYMAAEFKPYICVGINSYTENTHYGKPKR
ncbi:MAG: hypothetical protein LBG10_03000 [Treponema sp.]|jgi:hypothetical protein|nr:hypothetical protein [Treponema sp.]